MADLTDYDVKVGDQTITFRGPSSMTDAEVKTRAQQEVAFKSGSIPTTFSEGAKRSAGETLADNSGKIGTAVGLGGMLAGQPEVVAAAPWVGRGVQALGEKVSGRPVTTPSLSEAAVLTGSGLASAYGPAFIAKSGSALTRAVSGLPSHTLPQALAKGTADAIGPTVTKVAANATPAAVGEAVSSDLRSLGDLATRLKGGVSQDEAQLFLGHVAQGMNPSTAARIVGDGSASKMSALLTLLMRSRMRP